MTIQLKVGDKAPSFNVLTDQNVSCTLSHCLGKNVVLYFYPKDNTPGCTTEAKGFKALFPQYTQANTVILGVSKDSVASHLKFKTQYDLPFDLLADTDTSLCQAYGVYVEKSMFGKKYFGIERTTFLIDDQGIIQAIWRKVKVKGHAKMVLDTLLNKVE